MNGTCDFCGWLFFGAWYNLEESKRILSVRSGYTGDMPNPPWQVKAHETGHTEAVEIIFDEEKDFLCGLVSCGQARTQRMLSVSLKTVVIITALLFFMR